MASKYLALIMFFVKIIIISSKRYGSLTLVIDDTSSMRQDISFVRNEASKFMDIILTQKASQISDVVIVTFNDPVKSTLRLKPTKDRNQVRKALSEIKVNGGGDCPEYSLAGINTGLINSHQNSYLFVFTDASPKDGYEHWILNKKLQAEEIAVVKKLAQSKESQIFFFLTNPRCGVVPTLGLYRPYWDIAEATNGQVFQINKKKDLEQFLNYMHIVISGEGNVMVRKEIKPKERVSIPFSVDNQTQYVTVSASTQGNNVELVISSGPTRHNETIAWTANNKILKIVNPAPGNYAVTVQGSDATTIMIVGRTDFTFQHGFSERMPPTFSDESSQPTEGQKSYLLVKVYDPTNTVDIKTAQITSPDEKKIFNPSLTLKKVSDGYYATEQFLAPNEIFIITVIGEGKKTGEPIKRTAKTPIQPRPQNMDPEISIQGGGKLRYNTNVYLTCYVQAYPKPKITWKDDKGRSLAASPIEEKGKKDFVSKLHVKNLKHTTIYYCCVENDKGELIKKGVDLVIDKPFKINDKRSEASAVVEFGSATTLQCDITADIPMEIVWTHITASGDYIKLNNSPATNSEYSISNDGRKLTIKEVNQNDEGNYICEASISDDKETKYQLESDIKIKHTAPIMGKPVIVQIKENESKILLCTILKGYPKPEITWEFKDYRNKIFQPLHKTGDRLQISNANHLSAGMYKCIASNDMGKKEQETTVKVIIQPKTTLLVNGKTYRVIHIEYNKTEETVLTCDVISHTHPIIVWKNGKNEIMTSIGEATKNNEYEYTSKMKILQVKKSETYYCEAMNQISTTKSNAVYIDVTHPFLIVPTGPDNNIKRANYGEKLKIPCGISSHLPIKITWFKETGEVVQASDRYLISENGAVLTVREVGLDTRGKYTCKASIIGDETTQKTRDITVDIILEKPQVDIKLRDLEVFRGQEALLKCKVLKGFPKPAITWMVKYEKGNEFIVLPEYGEQLKLSSAQYHHAGIYKCVLKNSIGSDEGTEKLRVKGPPVILTDDDRVYRAIVGDDALVIPCDVAGYPKPNITWRSEFPSETKFDVNSDGSLVIKNPAMGDSDKNYICTATNAFGTDNKTFVTVVDDLLDDEDLGNITHFVVVRDTIKKLPCESGSLKGRWFKDGSPLEETGTLTVNSVLQEYDGNYHANNYTCRISDSTGSKSKTYVIEIQYKPILKEPEDEVIDWDGSDTNLPCDVFMQPKSETAEAKWYYNGKESYQSNGETDLSKHPIISWGRYTCNISNHHGFVVKNFHVYSSNCLINLNLKGFKYPLMLNTMGSLPKTEAQQRNYIHVESMENLLLSCNHHSTKPNFFQKLSDKNEIIATCDHEDKFTVNDETFNLSDLQCNAEVTPILKETGIKCFNENTELIKVGFNVQEPESTFVEAYSVCYDKSKNVPIYTKSTVTQEDNDRVENPIWLKYDNYYEENIRENCAKDAKCCLNKQQLVNEMDVAKGPLKSATFIDGLNSIPYWQGCSAVDYTWSELDNIIRSFKIDIPYTKISGALGYTSKNGNLVPRYLWKMVNESSLSFVIVIVNDPSPKKDDVLCVDKCRWHGWKKGFKNTYCCKVEDFKRAFNLTTQMFN